MDLAPRHFGDVHEWYAESKHWPVQESVADEVTIAPDTVEADEAPQEWAVTYTVREKTLHPGAHIGLEVPVHFKLDHGRPFPVGTTHVKHIDEAGAGYAAPVSVEPPSDQVGLRFAVSNLSRFSIVDVVVTEGVVQPGESITITLGDRRGSRLKAPKFSQRVLLTTAVDRDGSGNYRAVERMPAVDVLGGPAADLRVLGPSTASPGETVTYQVYGADRFNPNPASGYRGPVKLRSGDTALELPESISIGTSGDGYRPATNDSLLNDVAVVEATVESLSGSTTVTALDEDTALIARSNPLATDFLDTNVYWGDIHAQMYDSIGLGTMDEYFEWARDVERLDFCATANHYGGRYDVSERVWNRVVEWSNRFYDPGDFVTFVSYEWIGEGYGHRNIYYRGDDGTFYGRADSTSVYEECPTLEELWAALVDEDAIVAPHHTKFCGRFRTNWDLFHELQRLTEIYSAWGNAEEGGAHSVQAGLGKGHRVGFTGGTDTHHGQPGTGPQEFGNGGGLTAVQADELTRGTLFDALHARRTYATTGARLLLDFSCNGLAMGDERVRTERDEAGRDLTIRGVGTADVDAVELLRNNRVVASTHPDGRQFELEWTDEEPLDAVLRSREHPDGRDTGYYYPRIRQADHHAAWGSPIWLLDD